MASLCTTCCFYYNFFLFLWDDGSERYEHLKMITKDDPVTLVTYACKHRLLEQSVWKKLKTLARRLVHDPEGVNQQYKVMANKLTKKPIFHFDIQISRNGGSL